MVRKARNKGGRPSQGLDASLTAHITSTSKDWLSELVRESGLREGELVRRIIDDARAREWRPS